MENVNNNLYLLSLRQDLNLLSRVSLEIEGNLPTFEANSWLFPQKSYKEVEEANRRTASRNIQYNVYLELIIDKLYLILNLITKYLEAFPNVPEQKLRNIVRPKNLTLGAISNLLWKTLLRFKDVNTSSITSSGDMHKNSMVNNRSVQTNTYSTDLCSSCDTAISCIKKIVEELEMRATALSVKMVRKQLQEDIYDITQLGCMNRLTLAITEDIQHFIERLESVEAQNKLYSTKLDDLALKYSETLQIIKTAAGSIKKLRKQYRNAKARNENLMKRTAQLVKLNKESEWKIQHGKEKVEILEKSVAETTASLGLLSSDNENLRADIKNSTNEILSISCEKNMWKDRFSEMYLKNRRLETEVDELRGEVQDVKAKMSKLGRDCDKFLEKLDKTNKEILERAQTFKNLMATVCNDVAASNKKITRADAAVKHGDFTLVPPFSAFQVKGDPAADMRSQIEANQFTIKKLEQHNADLLRTIQRIHEKTALT